MTIIEALKDMSRREMSLHEVSQYYGVTCANFIKPLYKKVNSGFNHNEISISIQILFITENKKVVKRLIKFLNCELNNNYTGYFEESVAIALQELLVRDILCSGVALSAVLTFLAEKGLTLSNRKETIRNKLIFLEYEQRKIYADFSYGLEYIYKRDDDYL